MSRQGKVRLAKWYATMSSKEKSKVVKEVTTQLIARDPKLCNFVEWKNMKVIYRRSVSGRVGATRSLSFCSIPPSSYPLFPPPPPSSLTPSLPLSFRYASLFFIFGVDNDDNELMTMEMIHHFVEVLDRYFGNVCELDLIFNFHKAYFALDEVFCNGEVQETSKKTALRLLMAQDALQAGPDPKGGKEQGGWY